MRTVYLGTSPFAAAVLERLVASPHRPVLVITRPDRPKGRGRKLAPTAVAETARAHGLELIAPEALHAPEVLERIAAAEPDVLVVCAYGVLIREPLLSDYEILNVHPSLLPRWRGAAPVERAIMAGDGDTGVSIMRLTAGLDSGPVCAQARTPIGPDDDYASVAARLTEMSGDLLVAALDTRPPWVEQDEARVTYAHKIEAADRALDPARPPAEVERVVRALRPHIGARLPLPDGRFLGVRSARVDGPTLAAAGGRVRTDGDRLLLDCRGGALELVEIQPPGGRPMAAGAWLRGRPDPALTEFWLDPRLPDTPLDELVALAVRGVGLARGVGALSGGARLARHARRAGGAAAARGRRRRARPQRRRVRGRPARRAAAHAARGVRDAARGDGGARARPGRPGRHRRGVRAPRPALGNRAAARARHHADGAVRDAVASALAGRGDPRATAALIELSADADARVRDWATFALGTLAAEDSAALRDALAARLDDADAETRIEAVHGLALRGDLRAVEPALAILAAGEPGGSRWTRHALSESAIRLAALTGDPRFSPYLPPLDGVWAGTALQRELARAHERCTGGG